jgi:hypothetical protein
VLWIKGVIVPPIGTEVELSDPEGEDTNMNVARGHGRGRPLGSNLGGRGTITLDVAVPESKPWYIALFERPDLGCSGGGFCESFDARSAVRDPDGSASCWGSGA